MGEAFLDYKKGGSGGLDINGIIEDYYVYAGEKVSAGDFVEFVNGVASKVDYGESLPIIFNQQTGADCICSCLIDDNKVAIVYRNNSTASAVLAVRIATFSEGNIVLGDVYTTGDRPYYLSVAKVNNNKIAIAYRNAGGYACALIATISGEVVSFGTEFAVGSGSSSYPCNYEQIIALDENTLLLAWNRNRNSSSTTYGLKACVLLIENTTLSTAVNGVLNMEAYQHYDLSLCKLNSTSALLSYNDAQNSEYGTARVLQISGTTITSGSEYVFQNSSTNYIDSCLVDTNKVMIYYHDNSNGSGKAIIAQVSGTSVTFGSIYTLPICRYHGGMATIDTNKALLAYRDYNQAGTAITATVSGTVIEFGTPYTFSNLINNVDFGVTMISNDTALVAYDNFVDSTNAYGTAELLGVSDTEISNNITDTTYETQVRPATSLPCNGVASTNGMGGDDTGHKDIVSVYVADVPTYVDFASSIVPIEWIGSSDYLSATATNEYGEWSVEATSVYEANLDGNSTRKAFDGDESTHYLTRRTWDSHSEVEYLYLNCPDGVSIKPTLINMKYSDIGSSGYLGKIQGYNGIDWVDLSEIASSNSPVTNSYTVTTDEYYSAFRVEIHPTSLNSFAYVYDFKITSGTLKIV